MDRCVIGCRHKELMEGISWHLWRLSAYRVGRVGVFCLSSHGVCRLFILGYSCDFWPASGLFAARMKKSISSFSFSASKARIEGSFSGKNASGVESQTREKFFEDMVIVESR